MTAVPPVSVSDAAAARIAEVCRREGCAGLVLALVPRGCSGYAYRLRPAEEPPGRADRVRCGAAWLAVEPASELFVIGTRIDVAADAFQAGFVFDNPNERSRCGCGLSVGFVAGG